MTRLDPSQEPEQQSTRKAVQPKVVQRGQQRFEPRAPASYSPRAAFAQPLREPVQEPLTIVVPVQRARKAELEELLQQMRLDPARNRWLPFGRLPHCHFGRLLIWDPEHDLHGRVLPPLLILISDCDGPADQYLQDLVEVAGSGLDAVLQTCVGYPSSPVSRTERQDFLQRHRIATPANYIHRPGRTAQQIKDEAALRTAIEGFLDSAQLDTPSAVKTRARIIAFVEQTPALRWALQEPQGFSLAHRARECLHAASLPLALLPLSPVLVPALLGLLVAIRLREQADPAPHIRPSPALIATLAELEDHYAHNGFTAAGELKPGFLRQVTIAGVLQLIGFGTRHLFTRDSLAGVTTIHFARWIPIDGGRRVIFASNYDGSLEAYNDDFIDLVWWGLNLVFGNGYGYPKTRWLIFGGAKREQEFKDYLRRHQVPTPVWYSAYRGMTAAQVKNNAAIRRGLRGRMTEREAQQWLHRL